MTIPKVILFDFDNTIAQTKSVKAIRETGNYELLTADTLKEVRLYRPVTKILQTLKSQGFSLGLVTNAGRKYIEILLQHLEITHYFDVVVTYTDVGFNGKKPSATGIKLALEKLGVPPSPAILYIGDEDVDVVAAYNAGVSPVLASWASKEFVTTAPAIEMSSHMLESYDLKPTDYKLFAERCAEFQSSTFDRDACYFLPLDTFCNVVTMRDEMEIFCLGRYFSQSSPVTANLHDSHMLSKEIAKKEQVENYEVPKYWHDMLAHVITNASDFLGQNFDVISVIPAKVGKPKRLEGLLDGIAKLFHKKSDSVFSNDLLYFVDDAVSQKHLSRVERKVESDRALHFNNTNQSLVKGKSVLVIDDVTTTGSTLIRARELLIQNGATKVIGLVIAKTVSIITEEKICGQCGRMMWLRKNRNGVRFFSCSGYHDKTNQCTHTEDLLKKDCPYCQRPMRINVRRTDGVKFWSCTGWNQSPACSHSENI